MHIADGCQKVFNHSFVGPIDQTEGRKHGTEFAKKY